MWGVAFSLNLPHKNWSTLGASWLVDEALASNMHDLIEN